MILFPGSKINLGLNVIRRRPDGYHDIESVMVPTGWSDILEVLPSDARDVRLTSLGRSVACPPEKNLVVKAYRALQSIVDLPPVDIVLEKIVPDGAGLGGGSADASATLVGLNQILGLNLNDDELASVAATVGADCPFFIYNRPMYATGTGTTLTHIDLPQIKGLWLLIIKPESVSISTARAYAGIVPKVPEMSILEILKLPIQQWQNLLVNDFEQSIFPLAPDVERVKIELLHRGALYASMSGSGSAVYGIFENETAAQSAALIFASYPKFLTEF